MDPSVSTTWLYKIFIFHPTSFQHFMYVHATGHSLRLDCLYSLVRRKIEML